MIPWIEGKFKAFAPQKSGQNSGAHSVKWMQVKQVAERRLGALHSDIKFPSLDDS